MLDVRRRGTGLERRGDLGHGRGTKQKKKTPPCGEPP